MRYVANGMITSGRFTVRLRRNGNMRLLGHVSNVKKRKVLILLKVSVMYLSVSATYESKNRCEERIGS